MKIRILVVDDEAEIREMLARHLSFQGFDVDTAEDGAAALAHLERQRTDIVLSDIMMPGMDGLELLRAVRQQYPMVHVIMMTGYVTLENALACMRRGADTIVFKPFEDLNDLDEAIERAIEALQRWVRILHELTAMKPANSEQ